MSNKLEKHLTSDQSDKETSSNRKSIIDTIEGPITRIDCTCNVVLNLSNSFDYEGELLFEIGVDDNAIFGWLTSETAREVISVLTNALNEFDEVSG